MNMVQSAYYPRRVAEEGQGLLLMVMTMTLVATMIGMYSLQRARMTQKDTVQFKRASNVINTMNGVAQYLHHIYYNEANCDPYLMNVRLSQMSNRIYRSNLRMNAPLAVDSGAAPALNVSFGAMIPPPPTAAQMPAPLGSSTGAVPKSYSQKGLGPQDVSITYSVVPYGTMGDTGATRYEQTVTLINTCSPRTTANYDTADISSTIPGFGDITSASQFAAALAAEVPNTTTSNMVCTGGTGNPGVRGSIDSNDTLSLDDREVFMNYVRSGDNAGVINGTATGCADTNGDGMLNEVDLNVLDKTMKGYLYINAPSKQTY